MVEATNREKALELAKGAYDLHTHTNPSIAKRALDDFELVREADEYGMAGVMIKSHYEPTQSRAKLVNMYSKAKAKAYGAITLNWPVGGINPYAVENALYTGAKMVWMPTMDSYNSMQHGKMANNIFKAPGIKLYDKDDKIQSAVYEVLEVVKKYDVFVASGHFNMQETLEFCKLAREMNVKTILTHPDWERTVVPLEYQLEMTQLGVIVEKVWQNIGGGPTTAAGMAASMKALGAECVFMVTDRGQVDWPKPAVEMVNFIEKMLDCGISEAEIKLMVCDNPKMILAEG